jgi:hypothetical protein
MRRSVAAGIVLVLGAVLLARPADNKLPEAVTALLDKAEQIELWSLEPETNKVLGKTTIKDAETRKKVLATLYKGIKDSDGTYAKCFEPRHRLVATVDGKTVDMIICFECLQIKMVAPAMDRNLTTTATPQATFDKVLTDAKVPLPPKGGK